MDTHGLGSGLRLKSWTENIGEISPQFWSRRQRLSQGGLTRNLRLPASHGGSGMWKHHFRKQNCSFWIAPKSYGTPCVEIISRLVNVSEANSPGIRSPEERARAILE